MARGHRQTEKQSTGTAFGTESSQGNGDANEYRPETRQSKQGGQGQQLERVGRTGGLQTTRAWPGLLGGGIPASPWELVRRMSEEMNQLFDSLGGTGAGPAGMVPDRRQRSGTAPLLVPRTEVIRQPDALLVRVDLPGLAADEIDVNVEDGLLTISATRKQEDVREEGGFIRSELTYGTFFRTIQLPDGADEDNIEAIVRNGVLEIRIPIQRREQGRRVNVQSGQSDRAEALPVGGGRSGSETVAGGEGRTGSETRTGK
ncbi:MAG TPA: Hsp20/alpha crystallin family protein [Gemmatimonadales bacterium]|nr:Hsp20/alpha crystallin family protein [Gemmatimonadales bacterium]